MGRLANVNPLDAIADAIAFNSRDFGESRFEAWIYGIVCGWDDETGDPDSGDAMAAVAAKVGWTADQVADLRALHANWKRIALAVKQLGIA